MTNLLTASCDIFLHALRMDLLPRALLRRAVSRLFVLLDVFSLNLARAPETGAGHFLGARA